MGGNVLDHEAKRIFQRGEKSGEERGKYEEACANALEFFRNGASFEMVEKSIKCLSHEELVELNNQAKEENQS